MPSFQVEESIVIAASPEDVFRTVRNFQSWPDWSPWLLAEPTTALDFAADGSRYAWDGKATGAGSMTVLSEEPARSIDCELRILRPWKATSPVTFRLKPTDGGTQLTWTMAGSLPFFLFFMKQRMSAYVAADYRRGLSMLKDLIETGGTGFSLDFQGVATLPEIHYVGVRRECSIPDIGPSMKEAMAELMGQAEGAGIEPSAAPLSIYQDWNPVANTATYVVALPVAAPVSSAPDGCTVGSIPSTPTYRVQLSGAYRHLGNAWAAGMMHQQAKTYDANAKIAPFEIYENDPETTAEADLVTTVHFPAKP